MKKLILCMVLQFAISCNQSEEEPILTPQTIIPVLIGKGSLFGTENIPEQNIVISNSANWNLILNSLTQWHLSLLTETSNVDFNNFQLIAVFDKLYGSPSYEVSIVNILENAATIVVTIKKTRNLSPLAFNDQKFYIVKIPKSPKPVVFQYTEQQGLCVS